MSAPPEPDRAEAGMGTQGGSDLLPPDVGAHERRRRPTGAPPPLPRNLGMSGKLWLGLVILLGIGLILFVQRGQPLLAAHFETAVLRAIARLRSDLLTPLMRTVDNTLGGWLTTVLGWSTVVLLIVFRRWRHLFAFLGSITVVGLLASFVYLAISRPRPYGVEIIGSWGGFSTPSLPMVVLATCLIGMVYSLIPSGPARQWGKAGVAVTIAVVAFSRLYLGVDHPSDIVWGVILGVAVPLVTFRLFTPNEAFPVVYRRGKTAHLDVTGARGEAIRRAISDQLGLTVTEVKPIGLEASGGSTPLRLTIADGTHPYVFAKLYAKSHVRADRWYKLGRTILYGSLEDEGSFPTVRRFVEYEDYTLRLMDDMDLPVPAAYGIVEITPEREYVIVMEFFDGAVEINEAEIDDAVIDQGLLLIRRLWDAGLAHRDIKPGNLMVRDGRLLLVDAFFVQVRPSPWRQAVDLGNMMLVLAVGSDPDRVYQRALRYFTPSEIAEAFAATRGVASPTQLRAVLKKDGRDLLAHFRRLAPERRPIGIQRWSVRRVLLALAVVGCLGVAAVVTFNALNPVRNLVVESKPDCAAKNVTVLMAQALPSATVVPCIASLPSGWSFDSAQVRSGQARFWLNSDRAGDHAVTVTLTRRCDTSGARLVVSDEPGVLRFDNAPERTVRGERHDRIYRVPGGCVTYDFSFPDRTRSELILDTDRAIGFLPRTELDAFVRAEDDLPLCGSGESCAD